MADVESIFSTKVIYQSCQNVLKCQYDVELSRSDRTARPEKRTQQFTTFYRRSKIAIY